MEVRSEKKAEFISADIKDINDFCLNRCDRATNNLCRTLRINTNIAKCNDLFDYFSERGLQSCPI